MSSGHTPVNPDPPDEDLSRPSSVAPEHPQTPGGMMPGGGGGGRGAEVGAHDPYAPLRIPAVRYYLIGWFLAILGSQMQSLAVGVDIYNRTRNPASLGLSGLMLALPILLFSLPAGVLADRLNRHRIVLAATAATTLISVALAVLSHYQAPLVCIYVTLFVAATAQSLGLPARSAMLPQMVPPQLLASATTWNSTTFQSASIAGPLLGGLLLYVSPTAVYVSAAVLSGVFFVSLLKLEAPPGVVRGDEGKVRLGGQPVVASAAVTPGQVVSPVKALLEGAQFVLRHPIILPTILLDLLAVILGGVVYVLPVFSKDILHVSDFHLGVLRSAESVGALVMGLVIAHLPPFRRAGRSMLLAVAGFGLAILIFGLSKNFYLSFVALLLAGAADNISVVVRHTLVGLHAPNHMRGRINAVNSVFIGSSNELGGFRAGTMAKLLDPVTSVVVGGIGTLASVLFVAVTFPAVRKLGALNAPPTKE